MSCARKKGISMSARKVSVLVIDDGVCILRMLKSTLEIEDHRVAVVS